MKTLMSPLYESSLLLTSSFIIIHTPGVPRAGAWYTQDYIAHKKHYTT